VKTQRVWRLVIGSFREAQVAYRVIASVGLLAMAAFMLAAPCGCRGGSDSAKSVEEGRMAVLPAPCFAAAWRAELPLREGTQLRRLSLSDDRVFAYTSDNYCFWINRNSGFVSAVTQSARPQDTLYNAVVTGNRVVFPSTTRLTVFDLAGKPLHTVNLKYGASTGAVGYRGMVYLGVDHPNGGRLNAVSSAYQPYDISPEWELMTRGAVSAAPAAADERVYVASRDGNVYAVRADNRDPIWPGLEDACFRTGGPILADLAVDREGLYVASMDSKLYCLDLSTGRVRWTFYAGQPLDENSAPVPAGNYVFIYIPRQGLVAIEKAGRQEIRRARWVLPEGRQFLAADDKYAYVLLADRTMAAVDKQTGQVAFRSQRNDLTIFAINTSPKDSTIYAARPDGRVYGIRAVLRPGAVGEVVMADETAWRR